MNQRVLVYFLMFTMALVVFGFAVYPTLSKQPTRVEATGTGISATGTGDPTTGTGEGPATGTGGRVY